MVYELAKQKEPYKKTGRLAGKVIVACILCLYMVLLFPNYGLARGEENHPASWPANTTSDNRTNASKIITALELKADNDKSIELAKAKLLAMDDKRAQLLSRLSERITDEKSSGSGLAFLLTAVLIILS